ncbi:MAG: hypothetical protein V4675_08485 [Verrucomicrobiota bacterium]
MLRHCLAFAGTLLLGALIGKLAQPAIPPKATQDEPTESLAGQAPAPTAPVTAADPAARPTQPDLADWWDFLQTLERATLAELPALWDALPLPERNPPASPGSSPRHRMLIERWTELDPAGALAFVKEKAPEESLLFVVVFESWAQLDPEAALTALQGESNPEIQNRGVAGFLHSFMEEPAQLIQWAKRFTWIDTSNLKQYSFARECPDDLWRRLLAADRTGLYEIAAHLPPWFRQKIDRIALMEQATTDLPSALASLKERRLTQEEVSALAGDLGSLAKSHPASALAILEALSAASDGTPLMKGDAVALEIVGPLVKHLAASDPAAAAAFINKHLYPSNRFSLVDAIYPELFAANPAAALIVAQALPLFPTELTPLPTFKDRQTALDILPKAPPSWRRDQALQSTLDQWQRESPAEAQAWVNALPPGEWRDRASAILEGQAMNSSVLSLKLQEITLRHQPDQTPFAVEDMGKAASQAAGADPSGTLALLGGWPPGPARELAMEKAASFAAGQSTAKALDWVQQISDPSAQAEAVRGVLGIWTTHEPLAASEWLPTLAPGPVREAAVDRFAETIAALDPAASLAWAVTLTDPTSRSARLEKTYRKWVTDDPTASAALREIPGLSPADVQQLLTLPTPATK